MFRSPCRLVVAERRSSTTTRYRLLETIRQFAEEELDAAGESGESRRRFLTYMVQTLQRFVADLKAAGILYL